jgi:hypothetical protein
VLRIHFQPRGKHHDAQTQSRERTQDGTPDMTQRRAMKQQQVRQVAPAPCA